MQCPECKEIRHPGPCAPHWETMESAPTDGTHILACKGPYNSAVTFAQDPPTVVHYFNDPKEPGFYTSVNVLAPEHPFPATHWMPLPKPPRAPMPEAPI